MSEPEPIDLSQLQNINLRPDWVEDLQKRDPAAGEVVWGRAPDSGGDRGRGGPGGGGRGRFGRDDERGGGGGRPPFGRDNRGGGGGPPRGFRQDERRGPGGPPGQGRGPGDRGPRPGGNFGGGSGGPGQGRGPRPGGNFGGGGPGQGRGPRPEGGGGRPPFQERGGDRDERRGGGGGRFGRDDRGGRPPFHRHDDRPAHVPLPGWAVKLYAEPRALDAITRQIKASGRAYPVFELGRLFLASRDRYVAHFFRKSAPPAPRGPKGAPEETPEVRPQQEGPEQLFQCTADDSLWTSREEAVRHALHGGVLEKYYRSETVTVDPPKGIFTSIAVCGFSGAPLGPPNHHAYQSNVARIHRERFANLPIDRYKARIQVQKDEAAVAKWMESQTSVTQYVPLQVEEGAEPAPFKTTAEMEAHFLKNYAEQIVRPVREAKVPGNIPGKLLARGLLDLLRMEVESQQRFPMQLVQDLCRDLEKQHLKFFKRDKKATYVSRSRPHYLENEDHLSPRIRSIVGIVRANPGITYGTLVSTLAPHVEPVVTGDAGTPAIATPPADAAPAVEAGAASPEAAVVESTPVAEEAAAPVVEEAVAAEAPTDTAQEPSAEAAIPAEPAAESVTSGDEAPAVVAEETAPAPEETVSESAPAEETTPSPAEVATEAELSTPPAETEGEASPSAEGEAPPESAPEAAAAPAEEPAPGPAPVVHLSPEEIAILQDLRWLVQEGYVTEFATGELQILGRPHVPPTPKQEKAPKPPREKDERRKPRGDSPEGKPSAAEEPAPEGAVGETVSQGDAPAEAGAPEVGTSEADAGAPVVSETSGDSEPAEAVSEAAPAVAETPENDAENPPMEQA